MELIELQTKKKMLEDEIRVKIQKFMDDNNIKVDDIYYQSHPVMGKRAEQVVRVELVVRL